ncbi:MULTISPECIES: hypothetical protein [Actinosynnema]|uniref:hypothetical protein n=1 Tax=Actinosynnema TaxID=40566 RepID=UPI000A49AC3B|nr:hypothetical protein [Actinosynnema pretiosum]
MPKHRAPRPPAPAVSATAWAVGAALVGVVLCLTMVLRTSEAAFSGTVSNSPNSWETGSIALAENSSGSALYSSASNGRLTGGQAVTKCITVRYDGTITPSATIKLYGSATGALAPYLDLVVDRGADSFTSPAPSCATFSARAGGVFRGTLDEFGSTATDYASGVGAWSTATNGATVAFRFTITVKSVAEAQNKTAAATFTWEARG